MPLDWQSTFTTPPLKVTHACHSTSLGRLQCQAWQDLLLDLLASHPHRVEAMRHALRELHLQRHTPTDSKHPVHAVRCQPGVQLTCPVLLLAIENMGNERR